MDPAIERDFFAPAIRDMPLAYLRDWFSAASDAQVSLALSRYLLPRVMEALAKDQDPATVGLEVSLRRFGTGMADRWTEAEEAAIARFATLYLERFRASEVDQLPEDNLDDALCMLSAAGHDMKPLLADIWAWSDDDLLGLLARDWDTPARGAVIWRTAFWEPSSWDLAIHKENAKSVAVWYQSDAMRTRAENAILTAPEGSALVDHADIVLRAIATEG